MPCLTKQSTEPVKVISICDHKALSYLALDKNIRREKINFISNSQISSIRASRIVQTTRCSVVYPRYITCYIKITLTTRSMRVEAQTITRNWCKRESLATLSGSCNQTVPSRLINNNAEPRNISSAILSVVIYKCDANQFMCHFKVSQVLN